MRVLIGCEHSGTVRDQFRAFGHDAWSCDLLPDASGASPWNDFHIQADLIDVACDPLYGPTWDLMIAHPPCTYLSSSGLHWNTRRPERGALTEQAVEFARTLMAAPIARIAIENPIGRLSTAIRKPDQIIQPYMFGDDASKATCLWLKGLNPLVAKHPNFWAHGRQVKVTRKGREEYVTRYANQTDSGQNRLGPSADRWALRSLTYPGIARAMAAQWGR